MTDATEDTTLFILNGEGILSYVATGIWLYEENGISVAIEY